MNLIISNLPDLWRVMTEWLRAPDSSSDLFDQQSVGLNSGRDTCFRKIGEVVLSALPARLRTDDTQAYIRMIKG